MDREAVRAVLADVAAGRSSVDEALQVLNGSGPGITDLGFARLDTDRVRRTGDPEVVYGGGKSPEQIVALLRALRAAHPERAALATRLTDDSVAAVRRAFPGALVDEVARVAAVGDLPQPAGTVCIVAAGTSDAPVAAEAALTARAFGAGVERVDDVGVAGLHRLLAVADSLTQADCLIVVAGLEGALPSVVGGLTGVPLVAVPTSVGYGASFGGLAALLAMLNSCAPGVVVCNIDNGFGAGVFAARLARRSRLWETGGHTVTTAWFQCSAGASGDMFLGALVDAGAPLDVVQSAVDAIGVEPIVISVESVTRQGLAATKVDVKAPRSAVIRTWANVRAMLEKAELTEAVRSRSLDTFGRLAKAEAAAHRTTPEQVLFHEVGALDAIADVVGTAAALEFLGIRKGVATPVAVGNGMVRTQHGLMPVPGPAVLSILSEAGAPIYSGDAPYELCTPTGAALLASTVSSWDGLPPMRVERVGTGAGSRELGELPNVLRVVAGHELPGEEDVPATGALLIETNVDDLDPRLWPPVLAMLLEVGASDAWLTPIVMKKGRPAYSLSVLADDNVADFVRRVIFTETSAIGLRERSVGKRALEREIRTVQVDGVDIAIKIARLGGRIVNAQPEYEDVVAAAAALERPVKAVLAAATAAARSAGLLP